MNWQTTDIAISLSTSILALFLGGYAWRRRDEQGALWFIGLVSAVAWITFWYAFEAAADADLDAYIMLSKIEYFGLSFIPVMWLGFALNFSGKAHWLTSRRVFLLSLIPFLTIFLALTNDWHQLIWVKAAFDLSARPPIFVAEYGTGFWLYTIYAYLVFFYGSVILVKRAFDTWQIYRTQAIFIVLGTGLPWISNLLEIFDIAPLPGLYLNAIFLGLGILCFAFALFSLGLLDIMPLAYGTILNSVPDGLIVVDMQNRIVAINRFVQETLNFSGKSPIGQSLEKVAANYASEWASVREDFDLTRIFPLDKRMIELRISPLIDRRGNRRGRLFVFSDVTARTEVENAQRAARNFAETVRNVGNRLNSTLDTERIVFLIADSIGQLLRHSRTNIMLVDGDGFTTRIHEHRGYTPETAALIEARVFDYRDFIAFARAAQTHEPVIIQDTQQEPEWKDVQGLEDIRAFAVAPIRVDNIVIGFINLDGVRSHAFNMDTANRLQILAQQAAIAIKNARLYEQVQHQAEELERRVDSLTITQKVYQEIGFSFDTENLVRLSLDAALRLSRADGGFVALVQEDQLRVVQHCGAYALDILAQLLNTRAGIIGQALASEGPCMEIAHAPLVSALADTHAQIALPLYGHGETPETDSLLGIILLESAQPTYFTEDRFQLLGLIVDRVAAALENARLVNALGERADTLEKLYSQVSQLEQLKSDMIRIAAHDLKNPLSVILNYLGLVINDKEEFEANLDEIHKTMRMSAERMHQIIQDFLSLERIEQVAQQQTMMPIDLRDIIWKAEGEFTRQTKQKKQQFSITAPEEPCMVNGDLIQLYEAVTNFVGNAIKYTPEGGEISVKVLLNEKDVSFEVHDNGFGIPKEKQERLFQPFYRVQTRETRAIEGTGLGLHLTKNIIERQGGTVLFTSEPGKGSTFGFELPRYQTTVEPTPSKRKARKP